MKKMSLNVFKCLSVSFVMLFGSLASSGVANATSSAANGANLRKFEAKSFKYNSQRDVQEVTLTWKANRKHSFEIYVEETNGIRSKLFKSHKGTSIKLIIPPNGILRGYVRAEKFPNFVLPFAFESPLKFKMCQNASCAPLINFVTKHEDRKVLWSYYRKNKVSKALTAFLLVAPIVVNASPGTKLKDAIASNIVFASTEIISPTDVSTLFLGLKTALTVKEREYFAGRYSELSNP